jgi:hypothetical protein
MNRVQHGQHTDLRKAGCLPYQEQTYVNVTNMVWGPSKILQTVRISPWIMSPRIARSTFGTEPTWRFGNCVSFYPQVKIKARETEFSGSSSTRVCRDPAEQAIPRICTRGRKWHYTSRKTGITGLIPAWIRVLLVSSVDMF